LGGEVLLYFIVWEEVVKIEIWFEFKLVCNLEKIWKLERLFPVFIGHGPNSFPLAQVGLLLSHPREAHVGPAPTPARHRPVVLSGASDPAPLPLLAAHCQMPSTEFNPVPVHALDTIGSCSPGPSPWHMEP
jgi:hypothetical protein